MAAANSYLQRARVRVDAGPGERRAEGTASSVKDRGLRELVERHADAWERSEVGELVGMLTE